MIGNSDYPHVLPNPARDAALITDHLERVGFDTIVGGVVSEASKASKQRNSGRAAVVRNGQDLNFKDMLARVSEFLGAIGPGTVAVIYYAGHGVQVAGENYLVPIDATLASGDPNDDLIALDYVVQHAVNSAGPTGKVIVFLDACRNDPFAGRPRPAQSQASGADRGLAAAVARAVDPARAGSRGLAPPSVQHNEHTARIFIAYATAPGAVAYDGEPSDGNSPFAAALNRHLGTRGLELNELVDRVGLDVQDRIDALGRNRVQDPWTTTNLKVPYYFKPRSWWPMIEMTLLGLIAGLLTCYLTFPGGDLVNPFIEFGAWGIGLIFAAAVGVGTMRWGSRSVRDVTFAVLGTALAYALALTVLLLIRETSGASSAAAVAAAAKPRSELLVNVSATFGVLAYASGALMLLATLLCWRRENMTWRGLRHDWVYLVLPFLLTYSLLILQARIFDPRQIGAILIALIAGVLFTAGTALALKPQRSVFRGFGALTGAITVGLAMAIFFDVYFRFDALKPSSESANLLAVLLGTAWFGLLGAQIGYCFSFFVPEREPWKPAKDNKA